MRNSIQFLFSLILVVAGTLTSFGHIGSPGVIVQKEAGKYRLLVSVSPPDVVPGTAKVTVFVEQGRVGTIQARPVYFRSGDEGAPTHDELEPTADQPNRFEGVVWLMDSGSSSIELQIDGPDGKATVVAPVVSVATAQRDMPADTGMALAAMGILLFVLLVTIIGASTSDGILKPGQPKPASLGRKRMIGMGIGSVLLALMLMGGRSWWNSWADSYRNENLYKPLPIEASVKPTGDHSLFNIRLDTTNFKRNRRMLSFVVPDHGKLMHVFLIRTPGLDAFAHIHPDRRDTLNYQSILPSLPQGKYLVYADMVYRSGYAETLTDTIEVPAVTQAGAAKTDPDDSWLVTEPMGVKSNAVGVPHLDDDMVACGKPSASMKLADGSTMLWTDKPSQVLEAGKLYTLKFAIADEHGKAASLEPYLGMSGHAAILRSDGSVYIHLHPVGTYSMAAEESLVNRIADTARTFRYPNANRFRDSIDTYIAKLKQLPDAERNKLLMAGMPGMKHADGKEHSNMVEFPYAFPRPGHYRIWVQVKRNGQVLTGVFDTQVKESLL
ncbi:hypothetical protein GCM10023189_09140 [Nibrella saemangeumensis]|uniref:Oxygen tolerance n=1 Tax=Nibrella saemangeumensis TaxID=1084526 RepID=A0ABP8MHI2_9BACT